MRLRIRGPTGQSTVTLDDTATVQMLKDSIQKETSLASFDVKYGYPPKALVLDQWSPSTSLTEIDVKLNGEQLIVSKSESASANKNPVSSPKPSKVSPAASTKAAPSPAASSSKASQAQSSFSWGGSDDQGTLETSKPATTEPDTRSSSAPMGLSRKQNPAMDDPPELLLPELGGTLLLRIMPDDNSCLFRAVAAAVMPGLDTMTELRSIVAQTIQSNPDRYSKVVLDDKEPNEYCRWIQTEDAWGGQIELDILSRQLDVEICSIDVKTLRIDRYNEEQPNRCIVVYSGIHYDTIALNPFNSPPEDDIKVFPDDVKDEVLPQAVQLCSMLKDRNYYTDTAKFQVRCEVCGKICTGEAGATEHASQTGHYSFGEAS